MLGARLGANIMLAVSEYVVDAFIIPCCIFSFMSHLTTWPRVRTRLVIVFAFLPGALSGFSGASGSLKGIAIESPYLNRIFSVGAASIISFGKRGKAFQLLFKKKICPF
jgi:hypothetical protein